MFVTRTIPAAYLVLALVVAFSFAATVTGQTPPRAHYLHHEFLPPGVIGRIAGLVDRITAAAGYIEGMGHDMDIIAPAAGAVDWAR